MSTMWSCSKGTRGLGDGGESELAFDSETLEAMVDAGSGGEISRIWWRQGRSSRRHRGERACWWREVPA